MPARERREDPPPYELDDVRVVAVGTGLWVVALGVLLVADLAGARVPGWQPLMCVAGTVLGLVGLRVTRRRAARRS